MSFFTVVESAATDVEQAVVAGLKTAVTYVDNVVVTDILPVLETQLLAAIEKLGQEAVAALLGDLLVAPVTTDTPAASS
jgi:microcompartment protein CcmL/EutN